MSQKHPKTYLPTNHQECEKGENNLKNCNKEIKRFHISYGSWRRYCKIRNDAN